MSWGVLGVFSSYLERKKQHPYQLLRYIPKSWRFSGTGNSGCQHWSSSIPSKLSAVQFLRLSQAHLVSESWTRYPCLPKDPKWVENHLIKITKPTFSYLDWGLFKWAYEVSWACHLGWLWLCGGNEGQGYMDFHPGNESVRWFLEKKY